MKRNFFSSSCFALGIVTVVGCASDRGSAPSAPTSAMGTTLGALESAVAACRDQRDACEADRADATVEKSCVDAFQACKKDALDDAMPGLGEGVKSCSDEARACRKEAADETAKLACQDALKACVGDFADDQGRGDDAGSDEDRDGDESASASDGGDPDRAGGGSPVASCTEALRTCIEGDEQPKVCTEALRACLDQALPNRGAGREDRPDAGQADEDRGNGRGAPAPGDRGRSEEHEPADAGAPVDHDPPSKPDVGRGKPQR